MDKERIKKEFKKRLFIPLVFWLLALPFTFFSGKVYDVFWILFSLLFAWALLRLIWYTFRYWRVLYERE